jgi:hypothetical protein
MFFMSVPTAQLRALQLSGGMPPHTRSGGNSVRERAIIVRDILSSFKEDCLPSEYMPDVYQNILHKTNIENDPRSHVPQGDLHVALFRLGAYYEEAFPCVRMMQSDVVLSRIYCDKLLARFKHLFAHYDQLVPTSSNPDPRGEVTEIIQSLRDYHKEAIKDRKERRRRESTDDPASTLDIDRRFAAMLIIQLRAVCARSTLPNGDGDEPAPKKPKMSTKVSSRASTKVSPKSAKRSSMGTSPTSPRATQRPTSYLFQQLVGTGSAEKDFFALDLLESCSPESLEGLQERGLRELQVLLEYQGAAQAYQERFANLVTQEDDDDDDE